MDGKKHSINDFGSIEDPDPDQLTAIQKLALKCGDALEQIIKDDPDMEVIVMVRNVKTGKSSMNTRGNDIKGLIDCVLYATRKLLKYVGT